MKGRIATAAACAVGVLGAGASPAMATPKIPRYDAPAGPRITTQAPEPAANTADYLHVANAQFAGVQKSGNVLRYTIAVRGYNPDAVYSATPGSCFNSYWDGQFNSQGCWKRLSNTWIRMQLGYRYFSSNQLPAAVYDIDVTGADNCISTITRSGSIIAWPNGTQSQSSFNSFDC